MSGATEFSLAGRRLMIVEDEYMIAAELEDALTREGATVVGTAGSIARGLQLLDEEDPDAVVLDLNLGGEVSAPLAAVLADRNVPFVIVTGYGESWMTFSEFRHAHITEKPADGRQIARLLVNALAAPEESPAR